MSEIKRSTINVTVSPNMVVHTFTIDEDDGPLTNTPHIEMMGTDISRLVDVDAPEMDAETHNLYNAIKALSTHIKSVSIEPYEVCVEGPYAETSDYYTNVWPDVLYVDYKVVQCLVKHLKLEKAPEILLHRETLAGRRAATRRVIAEQLKDVV